MFYETKTKVCLLLRNINFGYAWPLGTFQRKKGFFIVCCNMFFNGEKISFVLDIDGPSKSVRTCPLHGFIFD